ncbi:MAG: metallophosphatase family protein [Lachnospiraceae bacterium]|nr:metallophosphatase family protein [Lachnospiraceae bacterium]
MSTKIGIISDTHGILRPKVLDTLKDCDYILHAGDFAEESVLDQIRFLGNLYVVKGNSDRWWADYLADKQQFRIEDLNFVLLHDRQMLGSEAEEADVIVYGHTHKFAEEVIDGRLWLNPGSCGLSRFGEPLTFAVMDVDGRDYTVRRIGL